MTRVAKQAMYVHSRLRSFFDEAIAEGFDYGDSDSLAYLFWNSIDSLAKLQTQQADNKALNVEAISNLVEDMYFPAATSRLEVRKRA